MCPAPQTSIETRERLLNAAGEVFAEQGFRNATIREICERAGANIAAVNYHFQSKEQFYAAVLKHAHACALQQHPPTAGLDGDASPRRRLQAFVRSFLRRIFDGGRPAWFGKLMAKEMVEPTAALDELVEQSIRPQAQLLAAIVTDVLPPGVDAQTVQRCVASIVGQCLFYHNCRPVIERLYPQQRYAPADVEALADHIAGFSFAALTQLAAGNDRTVVGEAPL